MKTLKASTGMWYTNGETFGKTVTLPPNAIVSIWYEVTDAEKAAMEAALLASTEE